MLQLNARIFAALRNKNKKYAGIVPTAVESAVASILQEAQAHTAVDSPYPLYNVDTMDFAGMVVPATLKRWVATAERLSAVESLRDNPDNLSVDAMHPVFRIRTQGTARILTSRQYPDVESLRRDIYYILLLGGVSAVDAMEIAEQKAR